VEITTETDLLDLELTGAECFGGTDNRVVLRARELFDEVGVQPDIRGKELCIESRLMITGATVQPGKVTKGERRLQIHTFGRIRGL
jgi:hypothetical protein